MEDTGPNLLEVFLRYYRILMRYKWLIVGIPGFVTLAVVAFAIISIKLPPEQSPLPNTYTAEAVLFVTTNTQSDISDSILNALGIGAQNRPVTGYSNGDMLLEILHSRTILDRLVAEFDIIEKYQLEKAAKTKAREFLLRNLTFNYSRNTGSLRLTYSDINPVFARDLVNRTVELLNEWFSQNRGIAKEKTKQSLEEKLLEVRASIGTLQNRLKNLQRKYGVLNAQELGVSQASALANLRSQVIMKEIEIKNYTSYSRSDDPHLEQLNEELRNLQDLISQNQTMLPSATGDEGVTRSVAEVATEFSFLTNELDIQQRIYNTLSPQYEAAKLSPESEPIFQVFEMAEVPEEKSGPRRSELVIKAFGGSFALSIALALFLHQLSVWKQELAVKKAQRDAPSGP